MHLFQARGGFHEINGVSLPSFLPETGSAVAAL